MEITLEEIKKVWDADWDDAVAEFGSPQQVPSDVTYKISEKYRALHVVLTNSGSDPVAAMKQYGVSLPTIEWVAETFLDVDVDLEAPVAAKPKIADKYRALDLWAFDHPLEQVTPEVLQEESGLSYASVMKYLKETPRYKKVKNGLYEAFEDQQKVL